MSQAGSASGSRNLCRSELARDLARSASKPDNVVFRSGRAVIDRQQAGSQKPEHAIPVGASLLAKAVVLPASNADPRGLLLNTESPTGVDWVAPFPCSQLAVVGNPTMNDDAERCCEQWEGAKLATAVHGPVASFAPSHRGSASWQRPWFCQRRIQVFEDCPSNIGSPQAAAQAVAGASGRRSVLLAIRPDLKMSIDIRCACVFNVHRLASGQLVSVIQDHGR